MHKLTIKSKFVPEGDQPEAIVKLTSGVEAGMKNQVLLGVTGSGKTFTIANIIEKLQMPALIISHNKTLAGQLYQEFREFFPDNAVSYFVSYYDYYQPEAYIPSSDTYIEKESQINDLIDRLRLQSTANIMTRRDTIVVASVSAIYNIGDPNSWENFALTISAGDTADWVQMSRKLVEMQYARSEFDFKRGSFRLRGTYMDIYPASEDYGYRVYSEFGKVSKIVKFDPLTGSTEEKNLKKGESGSVPYDDSKPETRNPKSNAVNAEPSQEPIAKSQSLSSVVIYPAKHNLTSRPEFLKAEAQIRADLERESTALKKQGKLVEAQRLIQKTNYDLEIMKEVGYVNGIENYSRYFDGRRPGEPGFSLIHYFRQAYGDNFLVIVDESHMTIPQVRGMYNGDYARKKTLTEYGFRLQAAFDNRPLKFDEFYPLVPHFVYVSATPDAWEVDMAHQEAKKLTKSEQNQMITEGELKNYDGVVEQLVRPTGIVDPEIEIRPAASEIPDVIEEIRKRVERKERVLVTTLTKKIAEDLTEYVKERNIKAAYLHSDIQTLERSDVLEKLRRQEYDVLIGVNLLREGLDLPEVTLVAILDADKEGFLRSRTSLIQTMGRAARNIRGEVIMYADNMTKSMQAAIDEIKRRREYQLEYNRMHNITPTTISKAIREKIAVGEEISDQVGDEAVREGAFNYDYLKTMDDESLTPYDRKKLVKKLEREMKARAENMDFEAAIALRDKIKELKS